MDANALAVFRNTRRNHRSAWGPKASVYPVFKQPDRTPHKATNH